MRAIRSLILSVTALVLIGFFGGAQAQKRERVFMTVRGPVPVSKLKLALAHEHVVTNFIGADSVKTPASFDVQRFTSAFKELSGRGVNFLIECTPAYIGRDAALLRGISTATGVNIITNTGIYAAVNKKYVPSEMYSMTKEAIAARWEKEFHDGIGSTGVRPGFIKLGVDTGPLDSLEEKLLLAAILVSRRTDLQIAVHTGDHAAAASELAIITREGYRPEKLIWVHAQNATDEERKELASKGVFISLDGVSEKNVAEYADRVLFMKKHGLLEKIILSHDDGWSVLSNGTYDKLELFGNGNTKPYSTIFASLLPMLKQRGVTDDEIDLIFRRNVIECFAIRP